MKNFTVGDKEPEPKLGDKIEIDFTPYAGMIWVATPCTCYVSKQWPSGDWTACGPHFISKDFEVARVFYNKSGGWIFKGRFVENNLKDNLITNIKELNSDGRTQCAVCGGQIKEPYPGIRYCPNCEK